MIMAFLLVIYGTKITGTKNYQYSRARPCPSKIPPHILHNLIAF
jgi:hypothetical protein